MQPIFVSMPKGGENWLVGWLVGYLAGWLVGWLVDQLLNWLDDMLGG